MALVEIERSGECKMRERPYQSSVERTNGEAGLIGEGGSAREDRVRRTSRGDLEETERTSEKESREGLQQ